MSGEQPFGVLGLGVMGGAMVRNLLASGQQVCGFDIEPRRVQDLSADGMITVNSAAELACRCEIVLVSVSTGGQLVSAVDGLIDGGRNGLLVVDASTVDPETSAVVRERIGEAGGSLLCAPVSGSAALAQSGRLTVFCSGSAEDYERATPLLDLLAAKHMWLGAAEEAPSAKLIVNLVVIGSMELVAESLALGAALGLSREAVIEQLRSSVISSPFLEYKAQAIVERDYEPTASLGLVRKDLALILRVAERHGVELPATDVIDDIYARGEGLGLRDSDFASVTEVLTNKETQT